jgi:RNA polymerase sigma factor (sigma-70 family)
LTSKEYIHRDIIEACMKNNTKAKYELYRLYSRAMFNICYRLTGNREDAEDMLQEAFTQAFAKLDSFRFESAFGAWLKRIVVNTCINGIKKKKPDLAYFDELTRFHIIDEEPEDMEYNTRSIVNAMEKLPQGGRMIFSLYLLEGYDHEEISQILNISESTSKTQFMRAKNRIIQILKEEKIISNE